MRAAFTRLSVLCGMLGPLLPAVLAAQRLVEPTVLALDANFQRWSFSTPFVSDSLEVTELSQLTFPVAVSFSPVRNWRIDVAAAYALGRVDVRAPDTDQTTTLSLDGPTDTKVRIVGRLLGERLWVTLGVNVPTGRVRLSGEEATAIRILGAPAFRMTAPVLGSGAGVIGGAVFMTTVAGWAVGLGASYEVRGSYTPLEASLAGLGTRVADLDPAQAVHVSLGFDRVVGPGRMAFQLVGDYYGTDLVTTSGAGLPGTLTNYQLGPTVGGFWEYGIATGSVRDLRFWVRDRYRTEFKDATGERVPGSSGNMLDAGVAATFGRPGPLGLFINLSGVFDTGMEVDNSVATAAMTSGRIATGLDIAVGQVSIQPFVNAAAGRLDWGPSASDGVSIGGGILLVTQW